MTLPLGSSPQLLRGIQLNELGRHADAETAIRRALADNPTDAFALHHLAVCQFHQPAKRREALATIAKAIALEPNEADHHILRSFILSASEKPKDALSSARDALALDPYHSGAFAAEAQAHLQTENWSAAEKAARQALALDGDNSLAANQLAQALRLQNKLVENAEHLAGMLARDPEDPFTHANAGWTALQRGNHRGAEEHFREALRIDPEFESAREGLLNSFRARSPFYRGYLRYCFALLRLTQGGRWAVLIGLYLAYRLSRMLMETPFKALGIAFCALYLVFALWVWVAKGVGNFFLLADRFAKHALRPAEKIEAVLVGGGVLVGVPLLLIGVFFGPSALFVLGCGLTGAAFPLSMTLTNESAAGRYIFGTIGFGTFALTPLLTADAVFPFLPSGTGLVLLMGMLLLCALTTWIGNIPALRRGST